MNYKIYGSTMPIIEFTMPRGQQLYAQSGAMKWMTQQVKMETRMRGGISGAFRRALTKEDTFVVNFTAEGDNGQVAFGHTYPGTILVFEVANNPVICQQRAFLCAQVTVDYNIHFQKKLMSGFFGGEGFIMQKFSGSGLLAIEIDGEVVTRELGVNETIQVETGIVGAFEQSVSMDIQLVKGFRNVFLGGEGMFLTTLRGPGKIWLQTMPAQNMAGELSKYLVTTSSK